MNKNKLSQNSWSWIPSLYYAQGLPYVIVMTLSVMMYKNLGLSNTDIALYTSWLYLPWVIKPLWSPFVDILKTKRYWILAMQILIGAGLAGVALTIPADNFIRYTMAFFWLLAFSSATHDIATDGFYMISLSEHKQAYFVGIRSTFYRFAMLTGQGLLVILAGYFEETTGDIPLAWSVTFFITAGLFIIFAAYHKFVLPAPEIEKKEPITGEKIFAEFIETFVLFFKRKNILVILIFILCYRLGESQLVKIAIPFMKDARDVGGLALTTSEIGTIYGTIGLIALTLGGIIGGLLASKYGLKKLFWLMIAAINLPNALYIYLSYVQPESLFIISSSVAIEQFGYGFGFTAFLLYIIYISEGKYKTAHYALATGFMALGMMVPGMVSGWIQETIGYQNFFTWVLVATIPSFVIAKFIELDPAFGKKDAG